MAKLRYCIADRGLHRLAHHIMLYSSPDLRRAYKSNMPILTLCDLWQAGASSTRFTRTFPASSIFPGQMPAIKKSLLCLLMYRSTRRLTNRTRQTDRLDDTREALHRRIIVVVVSPLSIFSTLRTALSSPVTRPFLASFFINARP